MSARRVGAKGERRKGVRVCRSGRASSEVSTTIYFDSTLSKTLLGLMVSFNEIISSHLQHFDIR